MNPAPKLVCTVLVAKYVFGATFWTVFATMIWVHTLSNPLRRGSIEKKVDAFLAKPHLPTTNKTPPTKRSAFLCSFYFICVN